MNSVDWDVQSVTRDLLSNNWSLASTPEIQRLDKSKRVNVASNDYVIISEVADRDIETSDVMRRTYDYAAVARIEIKSADRARRDEIWGEVIRIAQAHDSRRDGTPGNWDTLDIETTAVMGDESFRKFLAEVEFRYDASSRKP